MKHDLKKRVFLVQKYYNLMNISLVQRAWRTEFKNEKAPDAKVIKNIINSFEKTGSVIHIPHIVRDPTQKRQEAKNRLKTMVLDFPNLSIRKAASAVGVSPSLAHNIPHDDLHLQPYKFYCWHKIEEKDSSKRVIFAGWFLSLPACTKDFLICTDEAYFYLRLPINKQNNRAWASEQLNEGVEYNTSVEYTTKKLWLFPEFPRPKFTVPTFLKGP
jgi:hypothetical protein